VVVSIGPITTEALQGHGIQPDLHPEHPKMGHLLIAVAREADNLLRRKRGGQSGRHVLCRVAPAAR